MLVKTFLVVFLINRCSAIPGKDGTIETFGFDRDDLQDCREFFHEISWPSPNEIQDRDAVRLCQRNINEYGRPGKNVFATLFSLKDRIPLYSANRVILRRGVGNSLQVGPEAWDRVATTLCDLDFDDYVSLTRLGRPVASNIDFVNNYFKPTCRRFQATSDDYRSNRLALDRGHLSPNSINSQDPEKQYGTYTLTNAAPQHTLFNGNSWRQYECVTKERILDLVQSEAVFIMTGTFGTAGWMNEGEPSKNLVKIPKYFWKAVCYPGRPGTRPGIPGVPAWGYAIVKENLDKKETADYQSYITLDEFGQRYFTEPPFGRRCMEAGLGTFAGIFPTWDDYLKERCSVP